MRQQVPTRDSLSPLQHLPGVTANSSAHGSSPSHRALPGSLLSGLQEGHPRRQPLERSVEYGQVPPARCVISTIALVVSVFNNRTSSSQ